MSFQNLQETLMAYAKCMGGYKLTVRGEERRSWDSATLVYDGERGVLPNIPLRKLNIKYAIEEFLWYCRGDRFDHSITQHASMWKKLEQADGGFNSNYGQYLFQPRSPSNISQFEACAQELRQNKDSSRASMVLLKSEHLYAENTDVVCTYSIAFNIRGDFLNMHVYMRSNDVVFGLTNDAFCFNMIQRLMHIAIKDKYPTLRIGEYRHSAFTLHIYDRHFRMATDISMQNVSKNYVEINPATMDLDDLQFLQHGTGNGGAFIKWTKTIQ